MLPIAKLPAAATHLPLFRLGITDLRSYLLGQDIVYVGGGNTRNMLVLWHEWGLDVILREAWEKGTILCGISAGSVCWFEQGLSDSVAAGELRPLICLGFLQGSNCPHYDGEPLRRPHYQRCVSEGSMIGGYATDDWVGLHFVGSKLHQVVSPKPNANAYEVSRNGAGLKKKPSDRFCLARERVFAQHSNKSFRPGSLIAPGRVRPQSKIGA